MIAWHCMFFVGSFPRKGEKSPQKQKIHGRCKSNTSSDTVLSPKIILAGSGCAIMDMLNTQAAHRIHLQFERSNARCKLHSRPVRAALWHSSAPDRPRART